MNRAQARKPEYDYSVLVNPSTTNMAPFAKELMLRDSRIKVFPLADEFYIGKDVPVRAYVPRQDVIAIPFVLPTIEHQIGHMVEMKNMKRVLQPDWGLRPFADKWSNPSDKSFYAALAREIRVRAIQSHMDGYKVDRILTHPMWGEYSIRLPFGKFKSSREVQAWIVDTFDHTRRVWNLDRIRTEWNRKIDYLRDWMETKNA